MSVAVPAASVLVPSWPVPFKNVTVPVGTPELEVTLAVKVTEVETNDGLDDEVKVITGRFGLTVSVTVAGL